MGPSSSDESKQLAMFAESRNLPFISYTATAPELSDVEMYPNFMRTVTQDGPLTQVWSFMLKGTVISRFSLFFRTFVTSCFVTSCLLCCTHPFGSKFFPFSVDPSQKGINMQESTQTVTKVVSLVKIYPVYPVLLKQIVCS